MAVKRRTSYQRLESGGPSPLFFADRVPESEALASGLANFREQIVRDEIDGDHFENVLTFWGVGGTGKTELSTRLCSWLTGTGAGGDEWGPRPPIPVTTIRWDLEKLHHGVDIAAFLLDLRKTLAGYKKRWYSFDLALAMFLAKLGVSNEGERAGAADEMLGWVEALAQDFGLFGTLAKLSTAGIKKFYDDAREAADIDRARLLQPQLPELVQDIDANGDVATQQPRIVWELLRLLVPDLEELDAERPVLVVFIDTFERVQSAHSRLVQERIVNAVVNGLPYAFFVITGRNLVRWHELERSDLPYFGPATWPCLTRTDGGAEPRQHRVGNLSTDDGVAVLKARLSGFDVVLEDADLRKVVKSTAGLPIHLELVANLAKEVAADDGSLDASELRGTLAAVVQRLLEHLGPTQRRLLHAAAVSEFFDVGTLRATAEVDEGDARLFVQESLVRDLGGGFFPYALHEEVRSAVRGAAPTYEGCWTPTDWAEAAGRYLTALHQRFTHAAARDAIEERMHVHASAVRLALEYELRPEWVIEEVAKTPSFRYLMRLVPGADERRLDDDLHATLALFQAADRRGGVDDPIYAALLQHGSEEVRRKTLRWWAYRHRAKDRYQDALEIFAQLKDLPQASATDRRQYGVTLRLMRRFADAGRYFRENGIAPGTGLLTNHGRIDEMTPLAYENWQRQRAEGKGRRWLQELQCYWVHGRNLLGQTTRAELEEFFVEGQVTERILVRAHALEGLGLLDLNDPDAFAAVWARFEAERSAGAISVLPLRRMRLALLYFWVHGDPRYVEQMHDELGAYNRPSSGWVSVEILADELGLPVTPYDTQWAEPVEAVRDRWLRVYADIVLRAWQPKEEQADG